MKVSRSGYYKWIKNKDILNNYEVNRKDLGKLIKNIHKRKPSYALQYKTPIEYRTQLGFN